MTHYFNGFVLVRELGAIMRQFQKLHKAQALRNDGILVPFSMRTVKVCLNMVHSTRFRNAWHLIYITAKVQQGWC